MAPSHRRSTGGQYSSDDQRVQQAREQQAERLRLVSDADSEIRQEKARKKLEEEKRKQEERLQWATKFGGPGRRLNETEHVEVKKEEAGVSREEKIRQARERQAQGLHQVSLADAEAREVNATRDREEEQKKRDEKIKQYKDQRQGSDFIGAGRTTGTHPPSVREVGPRGEEGVPSSPVRGDEGRDRACDCLGASSGIHRPTCHLGKK